MLKLKKNTEKEGITLIALVITIIVLLILAGISITMLSGDNSILKRAGDAKKNLDDSRLNEEINLAISARQISKKTNSNDKTLKNELEKGISGEKTVEEITGVPDVCYVKKGNKEMTVYEDGDIVDGRVSVWDGITVESPEFKQENNIWNWYIYNPAQLKFLANFVNNGNTLTSEQETIVTNAGYNKNDVKIEEDITKVYLMNNIDLGARQVDGKLTSGLGWTPIGSEENPFTGIFEGNNNIIKGLYINLTDGTTWIGLFGYAKNIQNLSIKNGYIKCYGTAGAFTGTLMNNGIINNCHNINTTIESERDYYGNTAGIVASAGNSTQITDCTNSGKIIGFRQIAGIVGWTGGKISNCKNTGSIITKRYLGAGIVSVLGGSIENCTNYGTVTGEDIYIGGIVGYIQQINSSGNINDDISKCNNFGEIIGKKGYVGGIIGGSLISITIFECNNNGIIKGNLNCVGGIAGYFDKSGIIKKCKNNNSVISKKWYVGGIIGRMGSSGQETEPKGKITECCNSGLVSGVKYYVGGIAGIVEHKNNITNTIVEKCYNSGQIDGVLHVGGIVGRLNGSKGLGTVIQCYNKGNVTGDKKGEIIGFEDNKSGLNTLKKLFYKKNNSGMTAIEGVNDDEVINKIMGIEDDLNYEEFKEWIENQ